MKNALALGCGRSGRRAVEDPISAQDQKVTLKTPLEMTIVPLAEVPPIGGNAKENVPASLDDVDVEMVSVPLPPFPPASHAEAPATDVSKTARLEVCPTWYVPTPLKPEMAMTRVRRHGECVDSLQTHGAGRGGGDGNTGRCP
jgi:hypothetical protein